MESELAIATLNSELAPDSGMPAAISAAAAGVSTTAADERANSLDMHSVWTWAAIREIGHRYQPRVQKYRRALELPVRGDLSTRGAPHSRPPARKNPGSAAKRVYEDFLLFFRKLRKEIQ